jgi:hypothetical protein
MIRCPTCGKLKKGSLCMTIKMILRKCGNDIAFAFGVPLVAFVFGLLIAWMFFCKI